MYRDIFLHLIYFRSIWQTFQRYIEAHEFFKTKLSRISLPKLPNIYLKNIFFTSRSIWQTSQRKIGKCWRFIWSQRIKGKNAVQVFQMVFGHHCCRWDFFEEYILSTNFKITYRLFGNEREFINGRCRTISSHFLPTVYISFTKPRFRRSFWCA